MTENLIKKRKNKYGITDQNGRFVILPVFDMIEKIKPSLSYNIITSEKDKPLPDRYLLYKNGFVGIASDTQVLTAPIYENIKISQELYRYKFYPTFAGMKNGKLGYMDINGKSLSKFKYDSIQFPTISVLTKAIVSNSTEIINLRTNDVIYSTTDDISDITFNWEHCCFYNNNNNHFYVIDDSGKIITRFKRTKDLENYKLHYVNDKFLCYKSSLSKRLNYICGLTDYSGKILTPAKYSAIIPIKGTSTVLCRGLFNINCELLDKNCNVVMKNIISGGGMGTDSRYGIIQPLMYEKTDTTDKEVYFAKILKP